MENVVSVIFIFLMFLVFLYSLAQLNLLLKYLKKAKTKENFLELGFSNPEEVPFVTIQLPIYNEATVVERLLQNIAEIDYPKSKIEFQVLDDSTDNSVEKTAFLISELQNKGHDFQHLRRKNRSGFKAGALKEGLKIAKGEFIAIFDSDFLPKKDWLKKTIPHFKDEEIGVVQTRWGHLNRNYSLLTKAQAFVLDFHFILEQNGRNFGKHFINFNGTAGIWRKSCILDAGNWESDTLTEDLDLSYRAQMKNWKFKYLQEVETPAELPVTVSATKSQQFRWNKGAAENFQKNYKKIFFDRSITFQTKMHALFHLLNSSLFILIFALAVLSLPLLYFQKDFGDLIFWIITIFFSLTTLIFFIAYRTSFMEIPENKNVSFLKFTALFLTFFSIALGFSFHNSVAVLEGHFGKKSEFIRTPKFNLLQNEKIQKDKIPVEFSFSVLFEVLLLIYFGFAVVYAFYINNFSLILFHLMLLFGFGYLVFQTFKLHTIKLRNKDI